MIDVKHYDQYNSFFNKNVKLKTEIHFLLGRICKHIPCVKSEDEEDEVVFSS